jgi:hypothetical protein
MIEIEGLQIQYLKASSGETIAAVIPIQQWIKLESEYKKLLQFSKLKDGFKSAFQEIQSIKAGISKEVSLREFLNEC